MLATLGVSGLALGIERSPWGGEPAPPVLATADLADGRDQQGLLTDPSVVLEVPEAAKPAYGAPLELIPFRTRVTRIVGDSGQPFRVGGTPGVWGRDARHHYSKDQPWNADGTLLALQNRGGGSPTLLFLNGESYEPRFGRCGGYRGDDRWHPDTAYANVRIAVQDTVLVWFDVVNCRELRRWSLPWPVIGLGMSEGNVSADGRFVALSDGRRMFIVDMDPGTPLAPYPNRRIGPPVDISDCRVTSTCAVGWVSISPSGRYVVVAYRGARLRVYDVDHEALTATPRPLPASAPRCTGTGAQGFIYDLGHADMAPNPFDGGEDVIVGQEHCGNRGKTVDGKRIGGVVMVRLRDGAVTALTDPTNESYPHHVSARNYDRPGWVYVGYYPAPGKRFNDEIIAVKLDGSQAVERLAHKRSSSRGCYRCESHAVPSRDGRRVLWASNWVTQPSGADSLLAIQAYVVDTRFAEAR